MEIDVHDLARRTAKQARRKRERAMVKAVQDYSGLPESARRSVLSQMGYSEAELADMAILEAALKGELDMDEPGGRGVQPVRGGSHSRSRQTPTHPGFWDWFGIVLIVYTILRCAAG